MTARYGLQNGQQRVSQAFADSVFPPTSSVDPDSAPARKLDLLLDSLAARALKVTCATSVAIGLIRQDMVICRAMAGLTITRIGHPINSTGLTEMAIRLQMSQWSNDTESDRRVDISACRHLRIRSIIVVPIFDRNAVIGIFAILSSQPDAFSLTDLNCVKGLAERITEAVDDANRKPPSPTAVAGARHPGNQQPAPLTSGRSQQKGINKYAARIWRALVLMLPGSKHGRIR